MHTQLSLTGDMRYGDMGTQTLGCLYLPSIHHSPTILYQYQLYNAVVDMIVVTWSKSVTTLSTTDTAKYSTGDCSTTVLLLYLL